jgi:hypothetical protein
MCHGRTSGQGDGSNGRLHQLLSEIASKSWNSREANFECGWPSEYVDAPIERRSVGRYIRYAIMSRQIVYETSFLVILCVVSLFLFPASAGPYPAVHGPATALQAARSSNQLQAAIAGAPKDCPDQTFSPLSPAASESARKNEPVPVTWHGATSILRC